MITYSTQVIIDAYCTVFEASFVYIIFAFEISSSIFMILVSADSLTVESLLELLDEDSLRKDTALPSPEWSSDHIALLAEFRCKSRIRR